jgi:preprotein translocase subunit SecG
MKSMIKEVVVLIAMVILAVLIILVVLLQQGRRSGVNGAISGAADTFLSKNKARHLDAVLPRWTKYLAIAFFVLVILANILVAVL